MGGSWHCRFTFFLSFLRAIKNHLLFQRSDAVSQWGRPKSLEDLTQLFLDHLHSKISTTPFSPVPLSPESAMILQYLELLTKKGWWTVGSQPAADSISSEDEILGWGPRGGYVFQKGFVEFFCDESDVDAIEQRVERKGQGWVHWLAGNYKVWFMFPATRWRIDFILKGSMSR